jgi:salicylate hydroxylase
MGTSPHALIAGAGIGGLTAALCLSRAGFRVTLLERSKTLQAAGAGLQISPNASAILRELGILPALAAAALAPAAIHARRGRDGATLARMPLADAETRWGAPYLLVHRADLQQALLDAVAQVPSIALVTNSALAGFAITASGVALAVLRGNIRVKYDGDCLIGADGLRSLVRERLTDDPVDLPDHARSIAFRALIDSKRVAATMRQPESMLWLGRKAHVVHYPLRQGSVVNVVAVADETMPIDWTAEFWSQPADAHHVMARFARFDRSLRDLMAAADEWRCWPLLERPTLASWTKGPIALLGDAAHPMLPFLAQGAAQAIEDAAALGRALSVSTTIEDGFAAYQTARLARAQRVAMESRRQASIYHLSGPAALARNLTMRVAGSKRLLDRYDWLYRT